MDNNDVNMLSFMRVKRKKNPKSYSNKQPNPSTEFTKPVQEHISEIYVKHITILHLITNVFLKWPNK